jgi:NhaA family Na+:H+ antiporter
MAVFFFLVGLEIKREVLVGELASRRTAALPIAAAAGGMVAPALLYTALNAGGPGAPGWGIPMATDIAFALGILALLGDRVPTGLKVFLAALAIADDLGAVLVIAVFYTADLALAPLVWAGGVLAVLLVLNRMGARHPVTYTVLGVALWLAVLASGVHATVAGVLLALTIPARTRIDEDEFIGHAEGSLADFRAASTRDTSVLTNRGQQEAIHALESACDQAQSPLQKMEYALHGVVAFLIMPIFALANAGVPLTGGDGGGLGGRIALGIILGLVVGKPLGITLASWLAVRARVADLPAGVSWRALHGAGWLGGIGFTMSLFIAGLAFAAPAQLDAAKLGILAASALAGITGWLILRGTGRSPLPATGGDSRRSGGHPPKGETPDAEPSEETPRAHVRP